MCLTLLINYFVIVNVFFSSSSVVLSCCFGMLKQRRQEALMKAHEHSTLTSKKRVTLPKSPRSFAKAVSSLIDNASPRTSTALKEEHLLQKSERRTSANIVEACKTGIRAKVSTKKKLIELFRGNCSSSSKSGLARMTKISRTSLNRKPSSGSKKISERVRKIVEKFYTNIDVSTSFPNKTNSAHLLYVLKGSTFSVFVLATSS